MLALIDTPLKPKGKTNYEIHVDHSEQERIPKEQENEQLQLIIKMVYPDVDSEARWIKKTGKTRYSFKKHHVTDAIGLVLAVLTTPPNVTEVANMEEVLATADLPEDIHVYGDKVYQSAKNEDLLRSKKLKSTILHKAKKGKPLTVREKLRNKLIGKNRFKVERTFGGIIRWFNSTGARYKGILKMHTQNLIKAIYGLWYSAQSNQHYL